MNETEKIFEEMLAEKLPILIKTHTHTQSNQEAWPTSSRLNTEKITSIILVKLLDAKDKKKEQ